MKKNFLLILLINSLFSLAQSNKLTVANLKPYSTSKDTASYGKQYFPEIKYADKKVAEKINTFLQVDQLEHPPGAYKKDPFERIVYDENNCCSYTSFEGWEKYTAPKNILSLKIEGESSGAYPEHFDAFKNFDLTNGNPVFLKHLILESKKQELAAFLRQKVKKRIQDFLIQIRDSLANPKFIGENRERFGEQDTMYTECLESHGQTTLEYYEFYFGKDSITFVLGRCSNHAMRAIDDLYDYYIPIAYKDFTKYLSPYGKSLFDDKTVITLPTNSPEGKTYKGTISNIPITVLLYEPINDDTSMGMKYWYNKHKIPIEWSGKYSNGHFTLKEYNSEYDKTATIEADWIDNNKIIGTWKDLKTGKVLKLELTAY